MCETKGTKKKKKKKNTFQKRSIKGKNLKERL